jgi:glycosyltransferase involved in cell wall biosynthesis
VSGGRATPPSVSVVIPTHNRAGRIEETVAPLLAQPETYELVVVVDGSEDDSLAVLERVARDDARLRPLAIENRGAMGARHAGALAATGDVLLMLDDDVIAAPGLVAGHAAHHAEAERLVVLGYMPVESRPQRRDEFARELYAREYERVVSGWERDSADILASMWAGNFSIGRADYLALGPEVERIVRGYHEDMDLGLTCLAAGLTGVFDRSLRATHMYERSADGFVRDARSSGTNLPAVHGRHAGRVAPLPPDFPWRDLPAPLRALVRAGTLASPIRTITRGAARLAGRLGRLTLERRGAGLLWRMEQGAAARRRRP